MTMTAITADRYGSVDVLDVREVDAPVPAPGAVLVRVHAAALNPADLHLLSGKPFFLRLTGQGLLRPRHRIPGSDVAGRVEAVGRGVTRFRPGDEVFACLSEVGRGALAELVAAPEAAWAAKPASVPWEAAAAVPMAGVTALQALRDVGSVCPGQRVLVHGASGGVGHLAVQIAKALGAAEVVGVASTPNVERVASLGADRVIDYRHEDFAASDERYDLIVDTVGNRAVEAYRRALLPGGTFVTTAFLPGLALPALGRARRGGPRMVNMLSKPTKRDLTALAEWLEDGRISVSIDRCYGLAQAGEALRYLADGRARGKLVIGVAREVPCGVHAAPEEAAGERVAAGPG